MVFKQNKQNIHSGYPVFNICGVRIHITFCVFLKHCYTCLVNHFSAFFFIVSVFTVLLKIEYISRIHCHQLAPFSTGTWDSSLTCLFISMLALLPCCNITLQFTKNNKMNNRHVHNGVNTWDVVCWPMDYKFFFTIVTPVHSLGVWGRRGKSITATINWERSRNFLSSPFLPFDS